MANHQKRGFFYIYKGGTGNQRKKEFDNDQPFAEKKSDASNSRSWLSRISKSRSLNIAGIVNNGGQREAGFVEARKSTSCLEVGSEGGGYVEGRNSVSAESRGEAVVVEGRKSVSQIETVASVRASFQVKVLVSDMPSFMQVHAFRSARRTYDSLEEFSSKHIAHNIKKEFDKAYGPVWHCIVGSNFGSFVTHSRGCFLYFSMEKLYILLFRTKVKKVSD